MVLRDLWWRCCQQARACWLLLSLSGKKRLRYSVTTYEMSLFNIEIYFENVSWQKGLMPFCMKLTVASRKIAHKKFMTDYNLQFTRLLSFITAVMQMKVVLLFLTLLGNFVLVFCGSEVSDNGWYYRFVWPYFYTNSKMRVNLNT